MDLFAFVVALSSVFVLFVLYTIHKNVDWGTLSPLGQTKSPRVRVGWYKGYMYLVSRSEEDRAWYVSLFSGRHTGEDAAKAVGTPIGTTSDRTRAKAIRNIRGLIRTLRKSNAPLLLDTLLRAQFFGASRHLGQMYGDRPYVTHLGDVAGILNTAYTVTDHQGDYRGVVVAWLHDVLEDTDCPRQEIKRIFGSDVLTMVEFCTDDSGPNRRTRKSRTYERVRALLSKPEVDPLIHIGRMVKLADRIANVRSSLETNPSLYNMYCKEHVDFMSAYFPDIRTNVYDSPTRHLLEAYLELLPIQVTDRFYRANDPTQDGGMV